MQALNKQPPLLPYAPLLQLLLDIEGGNEVLKDVRAACTTAGAESVSRIMSDAASAIEKLVQNGDEGTRVGLVRVLPSACWSDFFLSTWQP